MCNQKAAKKKAKDAAKPSIISASSTMATKDDDVSEKVLAIVLPSMVSTSDERHDALVRARASARKLKAS